jgi:hypothetical protein
MKVDDTTAGEVALDFGVGPEDALVARRTVMRASSAVPCHDAVLTWQRAGRLALLDAGEQLLWVAHGTAGEGVMHLWLTASSPFGAGRRISEVPSALIMGLQASGGRSTLQQPGDYLQGNRLDDVPVEGGRAGRRDVKRRGQCRDRDRENSMERRRATQPAYESESIKPRHLEIAEDEIGLDVGEELEGLFPISGAADTPSECLDHLHKDLPDAVVIVHDEHGDLR